MIIFYTDMVNDNTKQIAKAAVSCYSNAKITGCERIMHMDHKMRIANAVAPHCNMEPEAILPMIEVPPSKDMGDFALPCFKLARALRKSPQAIAQQLAGSIGEIEGIDRIQDVNGYLNFYINPQKRSYAAINRILAQNGAYGSSDMGNGKTICIDYSSINIAKRCHIGHLSTTVIGHSLYKIFSFLGYKCVGINHLGDWGTQFGKLIYAYKTWGSKEAVEKGGIDELVNLYVRFNNEADEKMEDEARAWFKKIEDDDPEALSIFEWFKDITLRDVAHIYELLGIEFDSYAGESFYKDKWQAVVKELEDKGLLEESDGAKVVKLDQYNMPPCLILKKDGASLYATRDIAAAIYRKNTYDFYKCLYVVAYQQNLHFKQFFKVIELMGYDWANSLVHVPFGMVSFEGRTLKTRTGDIVYLEEFLDRAIEKALDIINEKSPNLEDKEKVARQVGVGAVVFQSLYNNRIKDVDFYWDRALNFDGETAPYVQYTHARCCSVLEKAGAASAVDQLSLEDCKALEDKEAQEVISLLEAFPDAILEACEKYEPYIITRHIVALAQAYNKFYFEHRILGEEERVQKARLALTLCTKTVIKTGLGLLGIETPEKM